MSLRTELISRALRQRFDEVCGEGIANLEDSNFGDKSSFVFKVRERFSNLPLTEAVDSSQNLKIETWSTSHTDYFSGLITLALGMIPRLETDPDGAMSVDSFLKSLHEARSDTERVAALTTARYACPLNFILPGEAPAREYLLTRLMAQLRGKAERAVLTTGEIQDLLLKLNQVAINAAQTHDLRFLDALNYYYELLSTNRQPRFQNNWLLVSYLALYAQALAAWLSRDN